LLTTRTTTTTTIGRWDSGNTGDEEFSAPCGNIFLRESTHAKNTTSQNKKTQDEESQRTPIDTRDGDCRDFTDDAHHPPPPRPQELIVVRFIPKIVSFIQGTATLDVECIVRVSKGGRVPHRLQSHWGADGIFRIVDEIDPFQELENLHGNKLKRH